MTPSLAARLGYEGDAGALISEVEPGSPAERAGLRRGDLIKEVNRRPIEGVSDLREALAEADPEKVLLLVRRGDGVTYVPVRP